MDLNGVDSDGVSDEVIDVVEQFREEHEDPTNTNRRLLLTLNMRVSQRDAEYIVECVRLILVVVQALELSLDDDEISDEAIEVFGRFLHETPCRLQAIWLWKLPQQQMRRLLAALKSNRSVKKLIIRKLQDNEGALCVADLLRHKTDFTKIRLGDCRFPFTQILPLLRGQLNLQELTFAHGCCSSNNYDRLLLFNDPEFTQLFIDNLLLSPSATLKGLWVEDCGVLVHSRPLTNRPSMAGFHKNTTLIVLRGDHDDATSLFIDPILRRNRYLGYVHHMLRTRMTTMLPTSSLPAVTSLTLPPAVAGRIVIAPTIPPPCGLWATVLAKVGQGTQGATPVFTILHDRLATWMQPSPRYENQNGLGQQDDDVGGPIQPTLPLQPETESPVDDDMDVSLRDSSRDDGAPLLEKDALVQNMDDGVASTVAAAEGCERFQSGVCESTHCIITGTTTTTATTSVPTVDPPNSSATGTVVQQQSLLRKKRAASTSNENMLSSSKQKPKSEML